MQFIDLIKQYEKISDHIELHINNVLKSGKYIMGPEVYELEEALSNFINVKHCISCSSGTDALIMALMARGVKSGDAILTTPFTFIATAEAIQIVGATPVFVDIDCNTFNINPLLISNAINFCKNKGLNPIGIIPVDLFGLPADYNIINKIAKENSLFVLEDAAQSFGGKINTKHACSFGETAITSFFPAKPLGCYGDGGAIFTDNENQAAILQSIRVHGEGIDKYNNIRTGINGRLDTIQAAILLEKLKIFPEEIIQRNNIAEYYTKNLPKQLRPQTITKNYQSAWAQYSIIAESNNARKHAMQKMNQNNIPTMIYYKTPLHLQKVFQYLNYKKGDFPIAENISKKIFSIPMHPYLKRSEQNIILDMLHTLYE